MVRGRLWRCSNPGLSEKERRAWTAALMRARRTKGVAMAAGDAEERKRAREQVEEAKVALGERGTPWWEQSDRARRERWEGGLAELDERAPDV